MLILTRIRKGYRRNDGVLPRNAPTSRFDGGRKEEALWTLHKFSAYRPQTVKTISLKRTKPHIVIGGTRRSVPSPFDIPSPEPHLLTLLSFDTGFEKRRIYARKCKEIQKLAVLRRFCLPERKVEHSEAPEKTPNLALIAREESPHHLHGRFASGSWKRPAKAAYHA